MKERSAIDTIKGYFYQFDCSIERLLMLSDDDKITIEGIEDIDIEKSDELTAVQCKYYAKSEYNHSVIGKPIRLMLQHFKEVKSGHMKKIKYYLYGHYKSGQEKLSLPIDINFLKLKFLTYSQNKIKIEEHEKLGLSDDDLSEFLSLLTIDIAAKSYLEQYNSILSHFMEVFSCDKFEAEYLYYNSALNEIRKTSIQNEVEKREISKSDFLRNIDNKKILHNKWFLSLKGKSRYHSEIKKKYFREFNKNPFERFFLIDIPQKYSLSKIKELVFIISSRYSNLKKREPQTYCPYLYLNNISELDLIELKTQLYADNFNFSDGVPFYGSAFLPEAIGIKADYHNQLKIKILKTTSEVTETIDYLSKTKVIYQFNRNGSFFECSERESRHIKIQFSELDDIQEIV